MSKKKIPQVIHVLGSMHKVERYFASAVCNEHDATQLRFQANDRQTAPSEMVQLKYGQKIYNLYVIWNGSFFFTLKPRSKDLYYCYRPHCFSIDDDRCQDIMDYVKRLDADIKVLEKAKTAAISLMKRRVIHAGSTLEQPKRKRPAHR